MTSRKKPGVAFWATVALIAAPFRNPVRLTRFVTWLMIVYLQAAPGVADDRLEDVRATAMLRSEYSVCSLHSGGGYGHLVAGNLPKNVSDKEWLDGNKLALVVRPSEVQRYGQHLRGMRLILVNGTKDVVRLHACDSRIRIVQEAQDATGKWRPIEYLQGSGCGNSYHFVSLDPGQYWEIVAPRYTGRLKTKVRFILQDEETIYSNEFDGTIDPDQFVRKPGVTEPVNLNALEKP